MKPTSLLTVILAGASLAACNPAKQASEAAPPRPVLAVSVHYAPRERAQALPGVVKARVESELSFRVGGRLERRLVDAGAFVHRGDALALLDKTDLQLQLEQAEAERAAALSAVSQAGAEEARIVTLARQGWAAGSDLDKTRSVADQARASLDKAERAVSLARNALGYSTLEADADGVISATEAEPGQVVAAGAPVVRLAHTDVKEAAVAIPETVVDHVRNAHARVAFWALPGVATPAVLRELAPNADPQTRTYAARFSLPEAPAQARLGMSVTVSLAQDAEPYARVPIGAVFNEGAGPQVWVVDPASGALTRTSVTVPSFDAESAYIASGVEEGARIVALGVHKLDAGQKVRIVENLAGL